MGAETCEVCERPKAPITGGTFDADANGDSPVCWRGQGSSVGDEECHRLGYSIQRARADAAERERDEARGALDRMMQDNSEMEATIATLREEVERLTQMLEDVREADREFRNDCDVDGDTHRNRYGTFNAGNCPSCAALSPPQASTTTQGGEG